MLTYVEVFTSLLGIFYSYIFTVYSWNMAMLSLELNNCAPTTLGTPLWIPQMGFGVLLLQLVRTLLEDIIKIKNNDFTRDFEKEVSK